MRLSSKIKRTISILLTLILLSTTVVHADILIIDEEDQLIMDESHDLLINDDSETILSDKSSEDVLIPDDTDVIETLDEAIEDAPGHKSFNILSETDDLLLDTNDGSMEVSPDMDGGSSVKKLQLGHVVLGAGVNTVSAATVYFGSKGDPLAWRVIGYNGSGVASSVNTATLLASGNISTSKFDDSEAFSFVYANSRLKTVVDNIYKTRFESFEDSSILRRKLEIGSYINTAPYTDGVAYTAVGSATLWPLSTKEAYYTNSDLRTVSDNWWLRSQGSNSGRAAEVFSDGYVNYEGYNVDLGEGVRPAFNLNFSSIILTSAAENGKPTGSAGTLKAPVDYTGTEWKLTVTDNKLTITQTENTDITRSANTVTVPYTITGSSAGNATQVSVLITDKAYTEVDAKILYYGALDAGDTLADSETGNGTGTFTLPDGYADKTCGTDYYAYILAEDINGDRETDYASMPVSITVPQRPILTISANDITYEYNGEMQGPGDVTYADPAEIATLVTATGLLDGDTLTSITIDGQGRDVGDYDLTLSQAAISNGGTPVNDKYDIKYVAGTLHIVPIPKNLQLVKGGSAPNIKGAQVSSVYFGNYKQTGNGSGGYNVDPIKWRVLQNNITDKRLFLLADQNLVVKKYNESDTSVTWETCDLRAWLNGASDGEFYKEAFSDNEKSAVVVTEVKAQANPDYPLVPYGNDTNDRLFLLSIQEVTNAGYGFTDDDSRKSTNTKYVADGNVTGGDMYAEGAADVWWLRSPGDSASFVALIGTNGACCYTSTVENKRNAVRPALNLDLSSILFTSAAVDGKKTETLGTLTAPVDYTGTEWKFTVKDQSLVIKSAAAYKSGDTVTVSYTFTGSPNRISVLITDKDYTANDAKIKCYGAIAEGSSLGKSATFTLPGDVADTDKLYLLAETVNGDKRTDIASVPVPFSIGTLKTYTVAFDANGGTGRMDSVTRSEDDGNSLPVNRFVYPRRKFTGWNTKKDGTGRSYPDGYKGNVLKTDGSLPFPGDTMTLYAQWDWGEIPEDIRTDIFKNDMSKVRERDVWFAFRYDGAWHEDTAALKKTYTGEKITFTEDIAVFHGFWKLWENRDYTISYSDNTKAAVADAVKAPAVTIKGRGSYSAQSKHNFTIEAANINEADVTSEEVIIVNTGTKIGSVKPVASYDGKKLGQGTDYDTAFYEGSEIDASKEIKDKNLVLSEKDKTYLVTYKGKNNFAGEKKAAVIRTVNPKDKNTVRVSTLKVTDTKGKTLNIKISYDELTKNGSVRGDFAGYIKDYFNNSKAGAGAQLMDGRNVLVYGRDYTISAPSGGSAGIYRIVVNGTGDQTSGKKYVGTKSIKAEVTGTKMSSVKIAGLASTVGYLGRDIGLADVFNKNDKNLESGWKEVTLYTVGKDKVKRKLTESKDGVTGDYILTMVNTGSASRIETYLYPVTRTRTITDSDGTQRQETYITWETGTVEKGGKFLFIVTGINGYTGTVRKELRIRPYDISEKNAADKKIKVKIDDSRTEYSKSGAFPGVTVNFNGTDLREGIDYKLTYKNNKKVAADLSGMKDKNKPAVIVKGIGNFKGSVTGGYFRIRKSVLGTGESSVKLTAQDVYYKEKGKAGYFIVKPVLMDGTYKLKKGKTGDIESFGTPEYVYVNAVTLADGTVKAAGSAVSAEDKVPMGTTIQVSVKVKCRENSNYSSATNGTSMSCTYNVIDRSRDIKNAKVNITKEAENKLVFNNGYAIQFEPEDFDVMIGNTKLETSHYEIESVKNVSLVGRATVVLRGKNGYGGTKKYSFSIGKMQLK